MEVVGGSEAEMQPRIRERAVSSSSVFVMVDKIKDKGEWGARVMMGGRARRRRESIVW